jgi:AraC family transcriptional regulator, regulatory protein of adaptative response / methylated-DNA-[protein]-cysteine methyltransferase
MNPSDETRWQAVAERASAADGSFVFAVLSTGIYCRPSCPARRPKRANVRFYADPVAAEAAGFRACRRCRPNEQDAARVRLEALCDYIREQAGSGERLTIEHLAARAALSPAQLKREFTARVGVTPRQFVESCRLEALRLGLRKERSVTDAIYEAGFGSASRVYERTGALLGMTPGDYRRRGERQTISHATLRTPLGFLLVGATERGLCFVQFGGDEAALVAELAREYPAAERVAVERPYSEALAAWLTALQEHLAGTRADLELPLDVRASAFRARVWRYLQTIPRGEVRSYSEVAAAIGAPRAVRAVASACAGNPTALVIPCHRVLRASGELGGYRWGLERKQQLLEQEGAMNRAPT